MPIARVGDVPQEIDDLSIEVCDSVDRLVEKASKLVSLFNAANGTEIPLEVYLSLLVSDTISRQRGQLHDSPTGVN